MVVYVALDDKNGMMFNGRRQSQDKVLREHLLEECKHTRLWMNEYSSKQFELPLSENIIIDEDFLNNATQEDCCFVENLSLTAYKDKIDKVVIFKWNRIYPADLYFDISLSEDEWRLTSTTDFMGNSHEKITKEIWINEKQ